MKVTAAAAIAMAFLVFSKCGGDNGPAPPTPTPSPAPPPHEVVVDKELMIRNKDVVESTEAANPDGAFAIKTLLANMAPAGKTPKDMMLSLLTKWETQQTVNGFPVPARPSIRSVVINPWKAKDGQPGASDQDWNMNFANAPFRLLAIVNRIDLRREDPNTHAIQNAGEGRFVFGVTNPANGSPLQFTVIFEYEQKASSEAELKAWADEWHALGAIPNFDATYINALKAVTAKFAGPNTMPTKPNGNALNQLRTNEIALSGPWELREFHLSAASGLFDEAETMQTPHASFDNSQTLADYITQDLAAIKAGTHRVPQEFPTGHAFRSGNAPIGISFWRAPGITDGDAMHIFSLSTCNACHSRETNTPFTHVSPRAAGAESALSGFLVGTNPDVVDPRDSTKSRHMDDLSTRKLILATLAGAMAKSREFDDAIRSRASRVH